MPDSRTAILDRIRSALPQAYLPTLDAAKPDSPAFDEPLADVFTRALAAVQGTVQRVESEEAARDWLVSEFTTRGLAQILCWEPAQLPLPGLAEALLARGISLIPSRLTGPDRKTALDRLGQIEVGLTGAAAGLARTGSLVLHAAAARGRLASLMPAVHYAILRADQLYPDLAAWLATSDAASDIAASSNTVIITGPSRSADIAQTLTLGAHGPKELHVVLIG